MDKIYLSPPHMGLNERNLLLDAFDSNWIAPLGPHVDAFEEELSEYTKISHVAALSSGTGALHLALLMLGVNKGDTVLCSDLTFSASANAITYVGAQPIFIDSTFDSWNMDPNLLEEALENLNKKNKLPKACIVVDLYGQCANYDLILPLCNKYEIPIIEDAAEALGALYNGKSAGSFGTLGVFSFNGNKIITTSGGGALVSMKNKWIEKAKFLATQARDPAPHYQHSHIGFNYRLSNLLAAVGRGQLEVLSDRVLRRRQINFQYRQNLEPLSCFTFMPEAKNCKSTFWLTALTINSKLAGIDREAIRIALNEKNIEARPVWKPMHLQPIFSECECFGGKTSEELFEYGLCLPSGSNMTDEQLDLVSNLISEQVNR